MEGCDLGWALALYPVELSEVGRCVLERVSSGASGCGGVRLRSGRRCLQATPVSAVGRRVVCPVGQGSLVGPGELLPEEYGLGDPAVETTVFRLDSSEGGRPVRNTCAWWKGVCG